MKLDPKDMGHDKTSFTTVVDGVEKFTWTDGNGASHSIVVDEDVMLNRKRAVQALRTADESLRCTGEVFEEQYNHDGEDTARTGRMCAIGVMYVELGIDKDDMGQTYTLFGVNPGAIYGPNDYSLNGSDDNPDYKYSWSEIGDGLASLWGID